MTVGHYIKHVCRAIGKMFNRLGVLRTNTRQDNYPSWCVNEESSADGW